MPLSRFSRPVARGALALMLSSVAGAALAQQPDPREARIAALEAQLRALSAEVAALKAETAAAPAVPAPAASAAAAAPAPKKKEEGPSLAMSGLRPTISSADGRFSVALRGVAMLDTARHFQDDPGPIATDLRRGGGAGDSARARDLADGTNFRRARLGLEGKVLGDFSYNMTYEFGGSGTEEGGRLYEASLAYTGVEGLQIKGGAFEPMAGLSNASTSGMILLERPAPAEVARNVAGGDSRVGLQVLAQKERGEGENRSNLLVSGAVTGAVIGAAQSFDEQTGLIGRAVFAPRMGDWLIQGGVNGSYVLRPTDALGPDAAGARYPIQLRDRPELRVDGTRLVDTGSIDAEHAHTAGVEFAAQRGRVMLQGEYFQYGIDRRASALADPRFHGWYVEGSWVLTGEKRRYNAATATFDAPTPDEPFDRSAGAWGAWELAARYSLLDLNFDEGAPGTTPATGAVRGGEQSIWTLGLNWYLNPNVRFMLQGQHVEIDRLSPNAATFLTPAGAQIGQELQTLALRAQLGF
ncbi:MAG TPA: porin [Caulobacteraceae bacterium]|jgi:phosphate-selective porin OprO/OprP